MRTGTYMQEKLKPQKVGNAHPTIQIVITRRVRTAHQNVFARKIKTPAEAGVSIFYLSVCEPGCAASSDHLAQLRR